VAKLRGTAARVSLIYARMGPLASTIARVYGQEQVPVIKAEHARWKAQHLEAWERGDPGVPDPPHLELDHFAR
jgi:hypothetical protein